MQKSSSTLKYIFILATLMLAVFAVSQMRSVQASSSKIPLMNYGLGNVKPIEEDEAGIVGTTGKTPAVKGEEPWLVGLIYKPGKDSQFGYFCAGTLVAPNWIVTAAHCLQNPFKPSNVEVVIGRFNLNSDEGEVIQAKAFYVHSQWQSKGFFSNDIGMIQLDHAATVGSFLPPVTAASMQYAEPGDQARTVGWGLLKFLGNTIPETPYGADFPITTEKACRAGYEGESSIDGGTICAGNLHGQASSCQGDSGSSLTVKSDDGLASYQAGIVSGGAGCGWVSKYGVYTRMSAFNDWVGRVMNGTYNQDDTRVIIPLTAPPANNFLGFTLKNLPFGFTFSDGYADDFEIHFEYSHADGRNLAIDAFNDNVADLTEAFGEDPANIFAPEEIFNIAGVDTIILDFGDASAAFYVKNGVVVIVDGEIPLDQMKTMVATIINNSK